MALNIMTNNLIKLFYYFSIGYRPADGNEFFVPIADIAAIDNIRVKGNSITGSILLYILAISRNGQ